MESVKTLLCVLAFAVSAALAQDAHHDAVNQHGDKVMGFSHEKTTHHFRLHADGGEIEVTANDPADAESRAQIRAHLPHIARMFADGNFNAPMLVHNRTPPGVPVLEKLKSDVTWRYRQIANGGLIRIRTSNPEALKAVHEFLRFQIEDHRTGDPITVQ
jgi:hypothetical protein